MENNIAEIEARIDDALARASKVVQEKLKPANALIAEVKDAIRKGTDMISTTQLQEWALAIPIICEELIPEKEAFALTKDLWDIETKQMQAKNLLELDMKKTQIETINKLAGTENGKKKAMAEYVQNMLNGTQESLWCLGNAIGKILNARIAIGDCR
nr:MAG TPA: hypothetical protein [Caudoviricetes sp.]